MYEFMKKYNILIFIALTVCLFALLTLVCILPELKPIDDKRELLYSQAQAIEEDFSSVREMSNVTISFRGSEVKVTFTDKFCTLNITYGKDGSIIAKEFEDTRLCHTIPGLICGIVLLLLTSALVSFIFVYVTMDFLKKHYKHKQKSEEQANTSK